MVHRLPAWGITLTLLFKASGEVIVFEPGSKVGWLAKALLNWSNAVTTGGRPIAQMLVRVWFTLTLALLVAVSPGTLVIVTRKLYSPASVNVAVVLSAALV